jgi:elongation factor P
MATTADVKVGSVLKFNGEIVTVIEFQHRTPGNLRAFYQGRMRNVKTGKLVEYRFRSGEEVELLRVEYKELQYLYKDGNALVCMDGENFEQFLVPEILFGDSAVFLKDGDIVKVSFESELPLTAEAPYFVELEITYTEPAVKGDTVNAVTKPATLETGAIIKVPSFVAQGERIKVDTRTGSYVERVK